MGKFSIIEEPDGSNWLHETRGARKLSDHIADAQTLEHAKDVIREAYIVHQLTGTIFAHADFDGVLHFFNIAK